MKLKRRDVLYGLVGLSIPLIASSCAGGDSNSTEPATGTGNATAEPTDSRIVRIGYQKTTDLDLLRTRGELDRRLQELGSSVEWSLFQSGPPMLEAMNAGSLDFGGIGDAPPIFAQAAGGEFYYVSVIPYGPETQDIIVPANSSIQSPADLRGKKVALQRGSSAHYLLLRVLEEAGIPVNEVEVVSLSPADARGAFEQGSVDAWSIWDPFLAVAQQEGNIRELKVGRERRTFLLSARSFTENHPDLLQAILEATKANGEWALQNQEELAEQFARETGLPKDIMAIVNDRRNWVPEAVNQQVQTEQQSVADAFYTAQIIPREIQVEEAFLPADEYAKISPF
ncbi:aliphatic sulfonate ABC transporter substrate-binding protein [Egbenema bharatensis]|uniref:aliphatic sulfonate ABC transporter substrate-binding protein n=1 Tax=Egbenema bharatensis TaxID=3463334 RepID=UPI003A87CFEF